MTLLVEGTQALNRVIGTGAPARTTSLPSSSATTSSDRPEEAAQGGKGTSLPDGQVEDRLTLSGLAQQGAAPTLNPTQVNTKQEIEEPSANEQDTSFIKEELEQARQQEQERLSQVAEEVNEKLNQSLSLRFRKDEETGTEFFQLVESETGDVVRQIPPESILEFRKKFETVSGVLFSKEA